MTMGDTFGPAERRPPLRGVSGWLLFLCISLFLYLGLQLALLLWVIFVAVRVFVTTEGSSIEHLRPEILILWVVMLGLYVLGISGGVLLYREKLLGVRLAQAFFGVQLSLGLITLIGGPQGVLPTLLGGTGLAYLFRSERVRNTYFENTSKQTAEIFR